MIEAAAGRAVTRTSSDGNRITVILAREDAEDFEINRAIRLVLTASPSLSWPITPMPVASRPGPAIGCLAATRPVP